MQGDYLFIYDVQDKTKTKIAELDTNFNEKTKTLENTGNSSLLVHFSTDAQSVSNGFKADIKYVSRKTDCSHVLDKTDLILTQDIDCDDFIITAPFVTSTINIHYEDFEVYTTYICTCYISYTTKEFFRH